MKIRRFHIIRCKAVIVAAALAVLSICPIKVFAAESITLPVQVVEDDIVSISLPVINESETSVFDFILDPQGLLYETDAVRYGGGRVEEGATLLFFNKEGEYDFSKHSDWLTVTNRSTVPVQVTVIAQVMDFGDVRLVESADFGESTEPEVYLAIEDDRGNILPLSANEQTTINLEMSAVPENTYMFRLDAENHTYQYGMSMDPSMVDFDTYSFGLIGACNFNAEWQNISIHPTIEVTWCVEPIISEQGGMPEENISESRDTLDGKDVLADDPSEENTNSTSDDGALIDDPSKDNTSNGLDDTDVPTKDSTKEDDKNGQNDVHDNDDN